MPKKPKYNSIARIHRYTDEGKKWINFSFVTPDHQQHELMIEADKWRYGLKPIPLEYFTHPACCEHPKGCPEKTRTERILEEFNA